MGSSPKTKAEYRMEIAKLQAEIERLKGFPTPHSRDVKGRIAMKKAQIAELRGKMANAPSK